MLSVVVQSSVVARTCPISGSGAAGAALALPWPVLAGIALATADGAGAGLPSAAREAAGKTARPKVINATRVVAEYALPIPKRSRCQSPDLRVDRSN